MKTLLIIIFSLVTLGLQAQKSERKIDNKIRVEKTIIGNPATGDTIVINSDSIVVYNAGVAKAKIKSDGSIVSEINLSDTISARTALNGSATNFVYNGSSLMPQIIKGTTSFLQKIVNGTNTDSVSVELDGDVVSTGEFRTPEDTMATKAEVRANAGTSFTLKPGFLEVKGDSTLGLYTTPQTFLSIDNSVTLPSLTGRANFNMYGYFTRVYAGGVQPATAFVNTLFNASTFTSGTHTLTPGASANGLNFYIGTGFPTNSANNYLKLNGDFWVRYMNSRTLNLWGTTSGHNTIMTPATSTDDTIYVQNGGGTLAFISDITGVKSGEIGESQGDSTLRPYTSQASAPANALYKENKLAVNGGFKVNMNNTNGDSVSFRTDGNMYLFKSGSEIVSTYELDAYGYENFGIKTGSLSIVNGTGSNIYLDKTGLYLLDPSLKSYIEMTSTKNTIGKQGVSTNSYLIQDSANFSFSRNNISDVVFKVNSTGKISYTAGTSSSSLVKVSGVRKKFYSDVSSNSTNVTYFYPDTVQADVLGYDGDQLDFKYVLINPNGTATTGGIYKVLFAGDSIVIDNGNLPANGVVNISGTVIRLTSSTAYLQATFSINGNTFQTETFKALTGLNFVTTNILKGAIQVPTSGTITAKFGVIEYKPNNP